MIGIFKSKQLSSFAIKYNASFPLSNNQRLETMLYLPFTHPNDRATIYFLNKNNSMIKYNIKYIPSSFIL